MAKIEEIKRRYKDEWVLVEVIEEDELGQPDTYEAMRKTKATDIAHFYTGEIPKRDMQWCFIKFCLDLQEVVFHGKSNEFFAMDFFHA